MSICIHTYVTFSLQNIFIGEDIRKQLPTESAEFDGVNAHWKVCTIIIVCNTQCPPVGYLTFVT